MSKAALTAAKSRYEAEVTRQWQAHPADGAHDLGHLRRVWKQAQLIAMDEPCDLEVLLAATMFHDLVNLPKSHPDRASASRLSAEAACLFLRQDGFALEKLPAVAVKGYAALQSRQYEGLYAISFPVLDINGYAIAALTVPMLPRIDSSRQASREDVISALRGAADRLSQING